MSEILFIALQSGSGGGIALPQIPSWEYLGALSVALFILYFFLTGKIVSRKEADERVQEWKSLAMEAAKENSDSTRDLVSSSKEYNDSLKSLVTEVRELKESSRQNQYEIKTLKDSLERR